MSPRVCGAARWTTLEMPGPTTFRSEYTLHLPLPIAQLYSRAHNAKDARSRHDNAFYLFEAAIKLTAVPMIAQYTDDVRRGASPNPTLRRLLVRLALPSLGQWLAIVRGLAQHYGAGDDDHPLAGLDAALRAKLSGDSPLLELYREIRHGPDEARSNDRTCTILDVFDSLVRYRNVVFGHGAARLMSFYRDRMGPLLFPAINELLEPGRLPMLGPTGSKLVHVDGCHRRDDGGFDVAALDLVGMSGARALPLRVDDAPDAIANGVFVVWPGTDRPLPLAPLLAYAAGELSDEVLFLNREQHARHVEYLSYTTGRVLRDPTTAEAMAGLLASLTGAEVTQATLADFASSSANEAASQESVPVETIGTRRVGDYELIAEIGRGGMGVVHLARQASLGRLVALKMLPAEIARDDVALARFRREMRALARCDHPGIVKLLDSGRLPDGRLYYTMEYVGGCDVEDVRRDLSSPGQPRVLADVVRSASERRREAVERDASAAAFSLPAFRALPPRDDDHRWIVTLMRDAALALHAVHEQQLVHRDVSPSNLMLSEDGSRIVLMDFGLAKSAEATTMLTQEGGFVGKLRYAAPEQLAAAMLDVGPPADVRGLGVTMWELLTRKTLFEDARDERQLAEMVHGRDVPRLRDVDPSFDRDIEAIVARAVERDVAHRIATAAELAQYLTLWLDGHQVPIRVPSIGEQLVRWARAHRALVATGAVAAILVVVATIVAFVLVDGARRVAEDERAVAEGAFGFVADTLQEIGPNQGGRDTTVLDVFRADVERLETIDGKPRLAADMNWLFGVVFRSLGETDDARKHHERSLEIVASQLPGDRQRLDRAHAELSTLAAETGRVADVQTHSDAAADDTEAGRVKALLDLSYALHDLGDYDRALGMLARAQSSIVAGSDQALMASGNGVWLAVDAGFVSHASRLARDTVAAISDDTGAGLAAILLLAEGYAHHASGRLPDAARSYRRSVETYAGADSPFAYVSYAFFAGLLQDVNTPAIHLPTNPLVIETDLAAKVLRNRARILSRGGQHERAGRLFRDALGVTGQTDTATYHTRCAAGRAAIRAGDLDEAEGHFRDALDGVGHDDVAAAPALIGLARIAILRGDGDAAVAAANRVVEQRGRLDPDEIVPRATATRLLADALELAGRTSEAATKRDEARRALRDALGADHPLVDGGP